MIKKTRIIILAAVLIVAAAFIVFLVAGNRGAKTVSYGDGPYTDEQLGTIYQDALGQDKTLTSLENSCSVQYVDKDASMKTVVIQGDDQVLVLNYDETGAFKDGAIRDISSDSTAFDALDEGSTINRVMSIDPNGDYGFLYVGRNDLPRHSYHYTPDGYCVEIAYDTNNEVLRVEKYKLEE